MENEALQGNSTGLGAREPCCAKLARLNLPCFRPALSNVASANSCRKKTASARDATGSRNQADRAPRATPAARVMEVPIKSEASPNMMGILRRGILTCPQAHPIEVMVSKHAVGEARGRSYDRSIRATKVPDAVDNIRQKLAL